MEHERARATAPGLAHELDLRVDRPEEEAIDRLGEDLQPLLTGRPGEEAVAIPAHGDVEAGSERMDADVVEDTAEEPDAFQGSARTVGRRR